MLHEFLVVFRDRCRFGTVTLRGGLGGRTKMFTRAGLYCWHSVIALFWGRRSVFASPMWCKV